MTTFNTQTVLDLINSNHYDITGNEALNPQDFELNATEEDLENMVDSVEEWIKPMTEQERMKKISLFRLANCEGF